MCNYALISLIPLTWCDFRGEGAVCACITYLCVLTGPGTPLELRNLLSEKEFLITVSHVDADFF